MLYDTQHDVRLSITQSDNDELNKREISGDRNRMESKKLANIRTTNTYLMKSEYICTFKNQKFDIVLATLYSIDYYEDETRAKWIFNDAITRKRAKLDDKFSEVDAFVKQKKKKKNKHVTTSNSRISQSL